MIKVEGLAKEFADRGAKSTALVDISFDVHQGEFFTLLGPSGCGKSTTLRCVAGLERPDRGTVAIGGRVVTSRNVFVAPNERRIGMVFQNYAIWPHMTVFENVAFPLRQQRAFRDRSVLRDAVMEALALVHMESYADRGAPYLSGGQQQRVAVARAIVGQPQLLLLDEPLSNLDALLRVAMRDDLRRICKQTGITTLYVTHDQSEALALSDRIAVFQAGRVLQIGSPHDIYRQPASHAVASFVGRTNFVEGRVVDAASAGDEASLTTDLGLLRGTAAEDVRADQRVTLLVRPEALRHSPEGRRQEGWNHVIGKVARTAFVGEGIDCTVEVDGHPLAVTLPSYEEIEVGDPIDLRYRSRWAWVLPAKEPGSPVASTLRDGSSTSPPGD